MEFWMSTSPRPGTPSDATPTRNPRRKGSSLSPIPSIDSMTSCLTNESHEVLLQAMPDSSSVVELEQSLSTIDLGSLIFFPDTQMDLELRLPQPTTLPQHESVFIEHLPMRPDTSLSKTSTLTDKYRNMIHQVRQKLSSATSSRKVFCGIKEAEFDSDSDSARSVIVTQDKASTATPTSACFASTIDKSDREYTASSFYTPQSSCITNTAYKRRAIYGSEHFTPAYPFTMSSQCPTCRSNARGSLYLPTPTSADNSPCTEYQKRRKSAYAILG